MLNQPLPPLGTIELSPTTSVIAGSFGTWTLTYTVGSLGIDSGGQIKVARRMVSDWGVPQFDDPQAEDYCSAITNGAAKLRISWPPRGYVRPKSPSIVIDVYDGSLSPGDTITLTLGDTSHGSPGLRAQTYIESQFEFFILVDPTNACDPRPTEGQVSLAVIADKMVDLVCLVPSQAVVGEPVEIFVKGEDIWRNPTPISDEIQFEWVGTGEVVLQGKKLIGRTEGCGYLLAKTGEFTCRSNSLVIHHTLPIAQRFWGDLHAQTGATVGVGSEDEYFTFGREWGRLDFTSHQGNDFQITDEFWQHLNNITKKYHEDGKFVVFPGYEWSASSPTGGDHNVFYRREGHPIMRSSHWLVPDIPANELSPVHPADVFYAKMKQTVPLDEVIVCQHVGGRYANLLDYFDQELIRLVEVVSVWGVFEWMLWDAFGKEYIVGVMCNSDGHHGRPGAEGAGMQEFGIKNGLTCVLSDALTRDAIFAALKNRRCYGTTGARILLDFAAGDHPMGSVLTKGTGPIELTARVTGAAPLESLQLFQGKELIREVRPNAFENLSNSNRIRLSWQGSRERGRQRRVTWDGEVRMKGCKVESVDLFSFDVIADGIVSQTEQSVAFRSKTTGDRDGLELLLDDASSGTIIFDSAAGQAKVDLMDLTDIHPRQTFDFGGVDMRVIVERYPMEVSTLTLELSEMVTAPAGKLTPYFVKATQIDGEMAWASPIYIDGRS
ncbi:DUF3604 domain-containing protein [Chloroflexi bacterium TSY]|nr:DUF3604 domain-containing protein [Chloroflexi bacterium TSY]